MATIPEIFDAMPQRYRADRVDDDKIFYFSLGAHKYTLIVTPDKAVVEEGKTEDADVVLKTTPELFEKMVLHGKMPGPLDIARGKIKTNDATALRDLRNIFDFTGL